MQVVHVTLRYVNMVHMTRAQSQQRLARLADRYIHLPCGEVTLI